MSESILEQPHSVTAQERLHPALRKLARACIALARVASPPPPVIPPTDEPDGEQAAARREATR